jgi:hypothetical protein
MLFLLWLADITLSFTQGLLFVAGSSAWANRSISLLDLLGTGAICGQYQGRHSWKLAVLLAGINQGDISCIWCDTCGWNPTSLSVNYCALLVSAAQIYIFDNRWHILYYGVCSVFVAFAPCYVSHISEPAWEVPRTCLQYFKCVYTSVDTHEKPLKMVTINRSIYQGTRYVT